MTLPCARSMMKFRVCASLQAPLATSSPSELIVLPWGLLFPAHYRDNFSEILYSRQPNQPNLLIFAHHATTDAVDEYVFFYLSELAKAQFDIVFCSTAPGLSKESMGRLRETCMRVIRRKNLGYDLGSYYVGWRSVPRSDLAAYRHVAFANDSVYGPIGSLDGFRQFMDATGYDMFGMTDSFERMYHIQTWFVVFKNNEPAKSYLEWFWQRFKFYNQRAAVISVHELGMTQLAIASGLKVGVFAPFSKVRRSAEARMDELGYVSHTLCRAVDPTQYYWRVLIENFDVPFVKRSLLAVNRRRIPDLGELAAIAARRGFAAGMIAEHLGWAGGFAEGGTACLGKGGPTGSAPALFESR